MKKNIIINNKFFIIIYLLFSSFIFSQKKEVDSACINVPDDILLHKLNSEYYRTFPKEDNNVEFFGCGTSQYAYSIKKSCEDLLSFINSYGFLIKEIRKYEIDDRKFKYMDVIWLINHSRETMPFIMTHKNNRELKSWRLRNQKSPFAIAIIEEINPKIGNHLQLKILFPKEDKEIAQNFKF